MLHEAFDILNKFQGPKFDETINVAFRLGVDTKQSDQQVRGARQRVEARRYIAKGAVHLRTAVPVAVTRPGQTAGCRLEGVLDACQKSLELGLGGRGTLLEFFQGQDLPGAGQYPGNVPAQEGLAVTRRFGESRCCHAWDVSLSLVTSIDLSQMRSGPPRQRQPRPA